jgi:hypothetical protein
VHTRASLVSGSVTVLLTEKRSTNQQAHMDATVHSSERLGRYTCNCSVRRVQDQTQDVSHAKTNAVIDVTPSADDDAKTSKSFTLDSQSTESSGETKVHLPGKKQRKRDRASAMFRKMLPGAGFIAGLAFVGERIWEVVENVS